MNISLFEKWSGIEIKVFEGKLISEPYPGDNSTYDFVVFYHKYDNTPNYGISIKNNYRIVVKKTILELYSVALAPMCPNTLFPVIEHNKDWIKLVNDICLNINPNPLTVNDLNVIYHKLVELAG